MFLNTFYSKLKKLNPGLRIDIDRGIEHNGSEWPGCGLYFHRKYLFGVPQRWIPEWSTVGVDFKELVKLNKFAIISSLEKTGLPPEGESLDETFLARGWRMTVTELVKRGIVSQYKAQKEFGFIVEPQRLNLPRNYIQYKKEGD